MNIALIGMSGVGKSHIGILLAEKLNYKLIDVDRIIEQRYGKKPQEIIDTLGDEEFLKIEEDTITSIEKPVNTVISPGGSSVYLKEAMTFLRRNAVIVFLDASLDEIKRRTQDFSERGIVGLQKKGLEQLFKERLPLYQKYADITIKIGNLDDASVVDLIVEGINRKKSPTALA